MKQFATLTIVALASTLGGCAGSAYNNTSLDSIHQPVVRNAIHSFDISTANGELPPSEQGRLQGWFDAIGIRYGDRIAVEDPSVYGSTAAIATVRSMVSQRGLMLDDAVPVTAGLLSPGQLRVTVTRASAKVPGCPDWASKSSINLKNSTSANYGCATNSNLAGMVADANDLIKGSSNQHNDPAAATRPIRTLREKVPTGAGELRGESTSGGNGGGK